jgi:hypothetical protein
VSLSSENINPIAKSDISFDLGGCISNERSSSYRPTYLLTSERGITKLKKSNKIPQWLTKISEVGVVEVVG